MFNMDKIEKINDIHQTIGLLKDFITPDFSDLGVFSDSYFKHIIQNILKDEENTYSIIYGDVNGLSTINDVYGKEEGDRILHTLWKVSIPFLPKDAIVSRLGGDEFIIVLPNTQKDKATSICHVLNANIAKHATSLHNTNIAFSAEDSKAGDIQTLIDLAEKQVALQKCKNKKEAFQQDLQTDPSSILTIPENISNAEQESWRKLNKMIYLACSKHISDIRPSDQFRFKTEDIKKEAFGVVNSVSKLLKNFSKTDSSPSIHCIDESLAKNGSIPNYKDLSISGKDARLINSLFFGNSSFLENLKEEDLEHLKNSILSLSNEFVRNKQSGLLSKPYSRLYLADQLEHSKTSYQAVYFSMQGIRPSNTAYSHTFTDFRIQKTAHILINAFSKKRHFNNYAFTFDTKDIFLTDQSGGNYCAFIPMDQKLSEKEINEIMEEINAKADFSQSDSTFKVAHAYANNINPKTIPYHINQNKGILKYLNVCTNSFISHYRNTFLLNKSLTSSVVNNQSFVKFTRSLKETCNEKKDNFKRDCLSEIDLTSSFQKVLENCVHFFEQGIENSESISYQKIFLTNLFTSLMEHEIQFNARAIEKEKKKKLSYRFKNSLTNIFSKPSKEDFIVK